MNRENLSNCFKLGMDYLYDLESDQELSKDHLKQVKACWTWRFHYYIDDYNDCLSSGALPSELN